MGTKYLKHDVAASLLSLRHVHLVFIQTLSSSYNVQNVKRRCSSRLKPIPEKFKPVLIQYHTVPVQFPTRPLWLNKFLLSPARSHCIPITSLSSPKLVFPWSPWWLLPNPTAFLAVLITVHCCTSTHCYTLRPTYPSNIRQCWFLTFENHDLGEREWLTTEESMCIRIWITDIV